jgi:hypothetical protein
VGDGIGRAWPGGPDRPNYQADFEYERELQAVVATRAIEEDVRGRDLHVVVAGDLDATPEAASLRFWRGCSRWAG